MGAAFQEKVPRYSFIKNVLEKLENGKNNVVDVTKAGCLGFFRVMQTSSPIDGNVSLLLVDFYGSSCKKQDSK